MKDKGNINAFLAILIAFVLVASVATGVVLVDPNDADTEAPITGDWVYIPLDNQEVMEVLETNGIYTLEDSGWAAIARINDKQRTSLEQRGIEILEIKDRTRVTFFEEGVSFDTTEGPKLAEEWTVSESDHYLVHFVAPAQGGWREQVQNIAGDIHRSVGSQSLVMEMNSEELAKVRDLDIVEWVGIYQPGFKVHSELEEARGEVRIRVTPYDISQVGLLKNQLQGYGALEIREKPLTDEIIRVTAVIDADDLPNIAALETVKLVRREHVMTIFNNKGTQVTQADVAWNTLKSNLDTQITGQGITSHIQATG